MGAEDFQPKDRLTVAKQVVKKFIAGRPADRIGVIAFSGAAVTRAPLTTDRAMLDLVRLDRAQHPARRHRDRRRARHWRGPPQGQHGQDQGHRAGHRRREQPGEIDPLSAAAVCDGPRHQGLHDRRRQRGPRAGAGPGDRSDHRPHRDPARVDGGAGRRASCCADIAERTGGPLLPRHRSAASCATSSPKSICSRRRRCR